MEVEHIDIKNAREHNLRSVSLRLPRNALIVFTGVSGSGKSSLAFDTLYAEGQRRYIESLSSYARQFMGQMQKPDCDMITGLSPAIAIQQKTSGWNPRSTVGTVTAVHDFLRVLYARVGVQHCSSCGRPISAQSREQIVEGIIRAFGNADLSSDRTDPNRDHPNPSRDREGAVDTRLTKPGKQPLADARGSDGEGARVLILAPVARGQKGEFRDLFDDLIRGGYVRARVDGQIVALREDLALAKNQRHDIEVVVDRLVVEAAARARLAEAVDNALRVGGGTLIVSPMAEANGHRPHRPPSPGADKVFSAKYACTHCSISFEPPTPQLFSFNSPTGMCMTCDGLGEVYDFDQDLLVPDPSLNFWAPCVVPMRTKIGRWRRHIYEGVAKVLGVDLRQPWKDLPNEAREALLYGTGDRHIPFTWHWSGGAWKHGGTFDGVVEELRDKYRKAKASFVREYYERFMRRGPCPDCRGGRLNEQALAVRLAMEGRTDPGPNIQELSAMSVAEGHDSLARLVLTDVQKLVVEDVMKELRSRLEFLLNVGLHYLTLDRTAPTLAGGELQRIRLAGQIGSGLVGVLYILDEPSIGLHPRDNQRLLDSLRQLQQMGNTVIVVEHDEAAMRAADHVVDFGPGPGVRGGEVVVCGTLQEVMECPESITGQYLRGQRRIEVPETRRPVRSSDEPKSAGRKAPSKRRRG
jgi:excinuclease ABC subunit A